MKNPITTLHIQNFKTIKDLKVKCKRINIIIGKPNVGKSNFLEALSLLGAKFSQNEEKFMGEFIRYKSFEDLFYDKETDKEIFVESNIATACIKKNQGDHNLFDFKIARMDKGTLIPHEYFLKYHITPEDNARWRKVEDLSRNKIHYSGSIEDRSQWQMSVPVKKYEFKGGVVYINRFHEFLYPPYGDNLFTIINGFKSKPNGVFKEIGDFFKEYKLQFAIRMSDTTFEVQKKVKSVVYPFAYDLIADTLQRMIFNIAAIESNKESILLFEEPEAHSFPPYVKLFAEKVIKSKTNQFFITTHSPFILNTIIENTPLDEVAIFKATYDKFETKMSELPKNRIEAMLDYGNDIFFSPELSR